jgi:hypothetical protein
MSRLKSQNIRLNRLSHSKTLGSELFRYLKPHHQRTLPETHLVRAEVGKNINAATFLRISEKRKSTCLKLLRASRVGLQVGLDGLTPFARQSLLRRKIEIAPTRSSKLNRKSRKIRRSKQGAWYQLRTFVPRGFAPDPKYLRQKAMLHGPGFHWPEAQCIPRQKHSQLSCNKSTTHS